MLSPLDGRLPNVLGYFGQPNPDCPNSQTDPVDIFDDDGRQIAMLRRTRILIVLVMIIGPISVLALQQPLGPSQHKLRHLKIDHLRKFENGLVISWFLNSDDVARNQIEIADAKGNQLVAVNALRLVPEAASVSIYDVSARLGQMIAVAAVYRSKDPHFPRPVDTLATLDFDGQLKGMFALDPSREITRLELDESARIWTLTTHSDNKDPATVPLIVEYDAQGNVITELLTRSKFPLHAHVFHENPGIGSVAGGYEGGVLWFWLPGSTDLVTVRTADASVTATKTLLPQGTLVPLAVFRQDSGDVIGEFRLDNASGKSETVYYKWSPARGSWERLNPTGCEKHRLLGVDGKTEIYVDPFTGDVCRIAEAR